jgi:hypothetical protein
MVPVKKVEVARIHKLASRCLAVAARKRIQCVKSKVHRWRDIETFPDILKTLTFTLASYLISYVLNQEFIDGETLRRVLIYLKLSPLHLPQIS